MIAGIGGGVVTDVTAFAASLYMRGCRLILVPTTLLSMVDAATGRKNRDRFWRSQESGWNLLSCRTGEDLPGAPGRLAFHGSIFRVWLRVLKHALLAPEGLWEIG